MNPILRALLEGFPGKVAGARGALDELRRANEHVRDRVRGLQPGSDEWAAACDEIIAESVRPGSQTADDVHRLMRCAVTDEGGPYWGTLGALAQLEALLLEREASPEYRDAFERGRREALDLAYRIVGTTTFAGDPWQYIAAVLAQIDAARTVDPSPAP